MLTQTIKTGQITKMHFYSRHLTFTLLFSLSPLPRSVLSSLSQFTSPQKQILCKPIINLPVGQIECGNAPQPAWDKAQCTTTEVTDASINPVLRWDFVNTEDAWTAALANWAKKGNNGLTFPQEISNFFQGPEQMLCGDTSSRDGCGSYIKCNNVNHPGGMFILNSFVALSNVSNPSLVTFLPLLLPRPWLMDLAQLQYLRCSQQGRRKYNR